MDIFEKIRVVDGNDLLGIAETQSDMLVAVDRGSIIAAGICPMPEFPVPKQVFILSTRIQITALTMNPKGKTIYNNPTSLPAETAVAWFFEETADAWFPFSNLPTWGRVVGTLSNQADLQAVLDAKLGVGTIANVVYSRVTGSNATTTGQVLTNVTGLSNPLVANAVYEFEAVLSVSTSAVTTGTAYGMNFSAAGATIEAQITGSSTSTASKTLRIAALNSATALYLATSGQTGGVVIKGTITTGANAGNLTVQHLKLTSGTSTVFINSTLRTIRIS